MVLTDEGAVLSFGYGGDGVLGHGDEKKQYEPKVIEALRGERVVAVSADTAHSLVLTEAGAVLSFGVGAAGRLGHGDTFSEMQPTVIDALRGVRVVALSAGATHSLVLSEAGAVFSFGNGRLGHGDQANQFTPMVIEALRGERVVAVAAGAFAAFVDKANFSSKAFAEAPRGAPLGPVVLDANFSSKSFSASSINCLKRKLFNYANNTTKL